MSSTEAAGSPTEPDPLHPSESRHVLSHKHGPLEWGQIDECLSEARVYWLSTAHPETGPHATPVWGLWVGGAFYFGGDLSTRWARNLAADPRIVVHIESRAIIILNGRVEVTIPDGDTTKELAEQSRAKYGYGSDEPTEVFMVRPEAVSAWSNDDLVKSETQWQLD